MISDLYWQEFLKNGSVYNYLRYTDALMKEGKLNDRIGEIYAGRPDYSGTNDR